MDTHRKSMGIHKKSTEIHGNHCTSSRKYNKLRRKCIEIHRHALNINGNQYDCSAIFLVALSKCGGGNTDLPRSATLGSFSLCALYAPCMRPSTGHQTNFPRRRGAGKEVERIYHFDLQCEFPEATQQTSKHDVHLSISDAAPVLQARSTTS
jgi:hypothetical protein